MARRGESIPVLEHVSVLLASMDRRYQERFEAQTKALDAAFLAQQTAVQAALLAQQTAVGAAMTASEKAVMKAEVAAEKRFDGVNEFRQLVTDLVREQMPRVEAEQRLAAMREQIDELKGALAQSQGRGAGLTAGWGYLVGAASLIGLIATLLLK